MSFIQKITNQRIHFLAFKKKKTDPVTAYDLWALQYDDQPDNLILALDEILFTGLIRDVILSNKMVVDVGCGTGRHWKKMLEKGTKKITGYDVSEKMLEMLHKKYPEAQTYLIKNNRLAELENESCDVLISTLTIAHIKNIEQAFAEWKRVLKSGGGIIITDYHPVALEKGADRTFSHNKKLIAVKSYIHSIEKIRSLAKQMGMKEVFFEEKKIDTDVKLYYEKRGALHIFEKFKGTPIIYGLHCKKS